MKNEHKIDPIPMHEDRDVIQRKLKGNYREREVRENLCENDLK